MKSNNKTTKEAAKPHKYDINYKKLVRKFIAKPLSYVTVFVLASYGMRQMLKTLDNTAATVLTVLAVLALVYIMLIED